MAIGRIEQTFNNFEAGRKVSPKQLFYKLFLSTLLLETFKIASLVTLTVLVLSLFEPEDEAYSMKYLHTMVRVLDPEASLRFYCDALGLKEIRRYDNEAGRFSLIFLATEEGEPEIELTHNWDEKDSYSNARNFGHLAYAVDNIYESCQRLVDHGVDILRPPRDGRMAFVKSPDDISIELLQKGGALEPIEPWVSMPNQGTW